MMRECCLDIVSNRFFPRSAHGGRVNRSHYSHNSRPHNFLAAGPFLAQSMSVEPMSVPPAPRCADWASFLKGSNSALAFGEATTTLCYADVVTKSPAVEGRADCRGNTTCWSR